MYHAILIKSSIAKNCHHTSFRTLCKRRRFFALLLKKIISRMMKKTFINFRFNSGTRWMERFGQ